MFEVRGSPIVKSQVDAVWNRVGWTWAKVVVSREKTS